MGFRIVKFTDNTCSEIASVHELTYKKWFTTDGTLTKGASRLMEQLFVQAEVNGDVYVMIQACHD
jgi:hypothetical protein